MKSKINTNMRELLGAIPDGSTLVVGGFGACGTPVGLIDVLVEAGARYLHIVSNNCGTDDYALGRLLRNGQIARVTASYVGDNSVLAEMYAAGAVELELVPQGTLAERMRAAGAGIPAFFTRTGIGTAVAEGGLPWRYHGDGSIALASPPRRVEQFNDVDYLLEHAVNADFALVHASVADTAGNLIYRGSARNFNPLAAMAGKVTIVEAEQVVDVGMLDPDHIHTPGIFVQHVVHIPVTSKRVDRLTVKGEPEQFGVMV